MSSIRYIDYKREWAAGITKMWELSASGWGGRIMSSTPEQTVAEVEKTPYLAVYLAINENDEVLGYISLHKSAHDYNAAYIGLLNVRPDYHGHKIGKQLVLMCVDKTLALGYDWLDIYTWSGNTKSVPLYKKCGYFWHRSDNGTHLFNFIPFVRKSALLADYFTRADWYKDSTREINQERDGVTEDGFEYWTYSWNKDGRELKLDFSAAGRGLARLSSPELYLALKPPSFELVSGITHTAQLVLENRTGRPAEVSIKPACSKGVSTNFTSTLTLAPGQQSLSFEFTTEPVEFKPYEHLTHPGLGLEVTVDGHSVRLLVGLCTTPALAISVQGKSSLQVGQSIELAINLRSFLPQPARVEFTLHPPQEVALEQNAFAVNMEPGQKTHLLVPAVFNAPCVWMEKVEFTAFYQDGTQITGLYTMDTAFNSLTGRLYKDCSWAAIMYNGRYMVIHRKIGEPHTGCYEADGRYNEFFNPPLVGDPLSEELGRKVADCIDFTQDETGMTMSLGYYSQDFAGMFFQVHLRLYASGIMERWFTATNNGSTPRKLYAASHVTPPWETMELVYNGQPTKITPSSGLQEVLKGLDAEQWTEPWLYTGGEAMTGVCWSPKQKLELDNWRLRIIDDLGEIAPGTTAGTEKITYFAHIKQPQLRLYVTGKPHNSWIPRDIRDLQVNGGNPFVIGDYTLAARIGGRLDDACCWQVETLSGVKEFSVETPLVLPAPQQAVQIMAKGVKGSMTRAYRCLVLPSTDTPAQVKQEGNKLELYWPEAIIKADLDFAPVVYHLEYEGQSLIMSGWPQIRTFSWWHPWAGGIGLLPSGMLLASFVNEEHSLAPATFTDTHGNIWQGITISSRVDKWASHKGIETKLNLLHKSGSPVFVIIPEFFCKTGYFTTEGNTGLNVFLNRPESDILYRLHDDYGQLYTCHNDGRDIRVMGHQQIAASLGHNRWLHVLTEYVDGNANNEHNMLKVQNNIKLSHDLHGYGQPVFMLVSTDDELLDTQALTHLEFTRV